jgi:hypothetical protein
LTPTERRNLAESLLANPLFLELLSEQEASATARCIHAKDDDERRLFAFRVQVIQTFRRDCEAALRSTPDRKGAPA